MGLAMRQVDARANPAAAADWAHLAERLRRLAVALTGDRDRAEDLCQGTLAAMLARAPEQVGNIGYARKAMLRRWLDEQRSLRRRAERVARLAGMMGTRRWAGSPEEGVGRAEALARVRGAMGGLPARQRAVLVMRLVEGLEYEQIAAELGCSVAAVRASLHLARQRVRRQVGEAL